MTDQWWAYLADVATVLVLFLSAIALLFNAISFRAANKAHDLDWLFKFLEFVRDFDDRVGSAKDSQTQLLAFNDHLNFLETCATAYNRRLLPRATKYLIRDTLIDRISIIRAMPTWSGRIADAITHPETFSALSKFYRNHKRLIDDLTHKKMQERAE